MKIRRFYNQTMRAALRQVAEEFGDDAAILSSQKTAEGVEVIAALDYDQALLPSVMQNTQQKSQMLSSEIDAGVVQQTNQMVESALGQGGRHSMPVHQPLEQTLKGDAASTVKQQNLHLINDHFFAGDKAIKKETKATNQNKQKTTHVEWMTDPSLVAMREELVLMRRMMSEQLKGIAWQRFSEKDPISAMLTRRLTQLGVNQSIAHGLIPQVKPQQDAECCWQNLLALLAKSISIESDSLLMRGGRFAMMGPAGCGKTTCIAKLAARFVIQHGADSVALIATDNYRISAQQTLSRFARLLRVPLRSVSAKHSLDYWLKQFKNKKLILIDSAGFSSKEAEISQQLNSLKQSRYAIKRFLLIPATHQTKVISQSIQLFKEHSPFSIIISKLDEASSLGEVLSLIIEHSLSVAWTTDGQKVPEDIRVARNHHLISKAVWLTAKYGDHPEDWQLAQELPQAQSA